MTQCGAISRREYAKKTTKVGLSARARMLHIPAQNEQPFWFRMNTYSGRREQLFRLKLNIFTKLSVKASNLFVNLEIC